MASQDCALVVAALFALAEKGLLGALDVLRSDLRPPRGLKTGSCSRSRGQNGRLGAFSSLLRDRSGLLNIHTYHIN